MNDKEKKKNQAHKNLLTDCTVMPQGLSLLHQDHFVFSATANFYNLNWMLR